MGGDQDVKISSMMGYAGHTRVDAVGFSGGIWVFRKPELVNVQPIVKHEQHITMDITRTGSTLWYFFVIYASPDPTKRKDLWKELKDFSLSHNKPWLIVRDFNETRFPYE